MATGDNLKPTKAVIATVLGFLAPGASYLLGVDSDGLSSTELVHAGILCVAGGLLLGGAVFATENKPKAG